MASASARGTRIPSLTRNQQEVMACLRDERGPMSAYQILDKVRPAGISHPPTIYRALNDLIRAGLVHRIESMQGFIACHRGPCDHRVGFAICRACRSVVEVELPDEAGAGGALAGLSPPGFAAESVSLEILGLCAACVAAGAAEPAQSQSHAHAHK